MRPLLGHVLVSLALVAWLVAFALLLWGTWLTRRHLRRPVLPERARSADGLQPISVLKPVKGLENGLEANLGSFFRLDYPRYELLFSIASPNDPAREVIEKLIAKNPRTRARLIIGEISVGANPKINNLVKSYGLARHDWILISDSNVRAKADYLKDLVLPFTNDVGIVTALVAGRHPRNLGGWLEAIFLNTFYARWMLLAYEFNNPVVLGKSMLFRRSEAQRFGGIVKLGHYLAEDYMAGQAMLHLGKKIVVMSSPVEQPIGEYSVKAFWSRHLRWGRIRKSQAPLAFHFEPLISSSVLSGALGAFAFKALLGAAFGISSFWFFGLHLLTWLSCDLYMMKLMDEEPSLRSVFAWLVRESSHPILWLHIRSGCKVRWRGKILKLARGGMLEAT